MDVRTLCLAVLAQGEATGYEIRKAFEEGPFAYFQSAAFGSIYPALKGLAAEGLIRTGPASKAARRSDKKSYAITEAGEAALNRALAEPPAPDRVRSDFCFILYFADRLPRQQVRHLLEARIAAYRRQIDCMDAQAASPAFAERTPGQQFVFHFGLSQFKNALAYLENHKDALIAATPEAGAPVAPAGEAGPAIAASGEDSAR